jgi:hypothetical protein
METQVALALASFLPYFLRAGKRAGEEMADALGTEAGRLAVALWERLRDKILGDPLAKGAAEQVAKRPDDPRALGALELQLEELLASNASLRREIATVLQAGQSGDASATGRSIAIGGGQRATNGGVNVGGDNAGTISTNRARR